MVLDQKMVGLLLVVLEVGLLLACCLLGNVWMDLQT
jgi:hypothetical protein